MTTPTITLYPDTLPAKGQANAAFDLNVDDFLTWQTVTNGPELAAMITWTVGVRDTVLATALAGNLPPLTGEALNFFRVNAAEDGGEFRTPAQVLGDIGGTAALALKAPLASPALTGTPTAPTAVTTTNTTQIATTEFVQQEIAVIPPARTLLGTVDIGSTVTGVEFTGLASFGTIVVEGYTVLDNSSAKPEIRVSNDNGSTYESTGYTCSATATNGGSYTGSFVLTQNGLSGTHPFRGELTFWDEAAIKTMFTGMGGKLAANITGTFNTAEAHNALRVQASVGNMTSGSIRIWGLG